MCPPEDKDKPKRGSIRITTSDDDCLCNVELYWVRVGENSSSFLRMMVDIAAMGAALLGIYPGKVKTFYHAALKVTVPEGDDCVFYIIELVGAAETKKKAGAVGQVKDGPIALADKRYGIRKWRKGKITDAEHTKDIRWITNDCDKAKCILDNVKNIPANTWGKDDNNYGGPWTSNSAVAWLLTKCGLEKGIKPPANGVAPGWDAGVKAGK
jgi:hypothetical protein